MYIFQERKREENLRKREEEQKQRELEKQKQRELEKQREREKQRRVIVENQGGDSVDTGGKSTNNANYQRVKVNFNDEESGSLKKRRAKKAKADSIENERRKAEEKLQRRMQRAQEKKKSELKSYAGFTDLEGEILHINVTKIVKKLGIAIDGGANTKQKAVIIREISVSIKICDSSIV